MERSRSASGLRRERRTAAAPASGVRVLEGEARALHRRHVVDRDITHVLRRKGIDKDPEAILVENEIILSRFVLDEERIFEPTAATRLAGSTGRVKGTVPSWLLQQLSWLVPPPVRDAVAGEPPNGCILQVEVNLK